MAAPISSSVPPWPRARATACRANRATFRAACTRPSCHRSWPRTNGSWAAPILRASVPPWRATTLVFSIAYAVAIFLLLEAHVPWPLAAAAPLLAVFQPQYVYFSDELYAENFFGLFTLIFFLLQRHRARLAPLLLAGLFAALAYEARTVGIALLVAWVAETLFRKDFRRLPLVLVLVAIPVVAWSTWIKTAESSPEYQHPAYAYQTAPYVYFNVSYAKNILTLKDPFDPQSGPLTRAGLVRRVGSNLRELPLRIGQSLGSWESPAGVSIGLGVLSMAGLVALLLRGQFIIVCYVVLSLAAMALTPFRAQFVRYLLPLTPFFTLGLFLILALAARQVRRRFHNLPARFGHAAIGAVVATIAVLEWQGLRELYEHHDLAYAQTRPHGHDRFFFYAPLGAEYDQALAWLEHAGRRTDVVAATDPQRVYLMTGMKAVLPPFELDGAQAQRLIDSVPVRYVIAEAAQAQPGLGAYHRYTATLLDGNPDCWAPVWQSASGAIEVYERRSTSTACKRGA